MIGKRTWEFDAARFTCDGALITSDPEAKVCSGEFLWAYEGREDHADILARLKADLTEFMGGWDLYPNVDPKLLFERRWEWKS